jgi:Arc/MetJ family transcription regulator
LKSASNDAILDAVDKGDLPMRTTITLDDKLLEAAKKYAGSDETSTVVRQALTAFVQREAGRRLAKLGGSDPDAKAAPRRRPWDEAAE